MNRATILGCVVVANLATLAVAYGTVRVSYAIERNLAYQACIESRTLEQLPNPAQICRDRERNP